MDITRATELIGYLADGVDPFTGEMLSEDCICNQAEMIRAFHCILNELKSMPKKAKRTLPENAGKPWNDEDDQVLIEMFEKGYPPKEIEEYFKRTRGSIAARLVRLGKIQFRDEYGKQ